MEFLSSHNCKVALMVSLHNGLAQRQFQPFCEPVADPGISSGGGGGAQVRMWQGAGTGEGVAGGGAKQEAEPPRGGCGRRAPLPPS